MRQTLESRIAAAEKLRKAAELEKLEKEETARNALAEQEVIMDKVVQESKTLQKEAEENAKVDTNFPVTEYFRVTIKLNNDYYLTSPFNFDLLKLREFLVDHGCVVDTLQ